MSRDRRIPPVKLQAKSTHSDVLAYIISDADAG